jgi:DNA-binding NarL/FixJ family response regulator
VSGTELGVIGPAPDRRAGADSRPLRILLVDQARLFAEALRQRLIEEPDVVQVSMATTAAEALRRLTEEPFSVVVASASLARELWSSPYRHDYARSASPVVVLANLGDDEHVRDLFRLGVVGWVTRNKSSADLMTAIRSCCRGEVSIPLEVFSLLAQEQAAPPRLDSARDRVLKRLTEREVPIFALLEQGMGRAEIATALHLSPNTVRTHVQRILRRLDVHSTLAALALVRA